MPGFLDLTSEAVSAAPEQSMGVYTVQHASLTDSTACTHLIKWINFLECSWNLESSLLQTTVFYFPFFRFICEKKQNIWLLG
jgi:hypothetical protein